MKKDILFIINPKSGIGKQKRIINEVMEHLDPDEFTPEFVYTQYPKHALEISRDASSKYHVVVAIGGDGTVNEVSRGIMGSAVTLAIIPTGSGNGLARFLKIPISIPKAIETINKYKVIKIDYAKINDTFFINVAGLGFDAQISHMFANYGTRGLFSYVKLIMKEIFTYKSLNYKLNIDGQEYFENAFLISFANSSTWGNNGHIAPNAKIDDGLLDVAIAKDFPRLLCFSLAFRLLNKTIEKSKYVTIIRGKNIRITGYDSFNAHIDGEPVVFGNEINIEVIPKSINIIVG